MVFLSFFLSKSRKRRRRRLLGTVFFFLWNLFHSGWLMIVMRVLTVCQEMERKKKGGLFGAGPEWRERERAEFHVEEWGGVGGFLCALFEAEVLTEGPWPPLSRNSLTLSLRAWRAHMLHSRGWTGAQGGAVRWGSTGSANQPSNTILSSGGVFAWGRSSQCPCA